MLLFCGVLLFLPLIIPGLTARDSIDDFSFGGASFFALNQPAADGADKINILRCRGRVIRASFYPSSVTASPRHLQLCTPQCAHWGALKGKA